MDKDKQPNWSKLIGWAVFGLVIAGGPLLTAFQRATGVQLPSYTLPALIALLLVASALASVGQRVRSAGDQPASGVDQPARPANAPMPPFAGDSPFPVFPTGPAYPAGEPLPDRPDGSAAPQPVRPPRFEPVVSLPVVLIGLVGLAVLALLGFVMFAIP